MKKIIFIVSSFHIAGGTERVVVEHMKICSNFCDVTLFIGDNRNYFYSIPKSIRVKWTGLILKQNMNSRLSRLASLLDFLINSFVRLPTLLQPYRQANATIYCASPLQLFAIYLARQDLKNVIVSEHSAWNGYNLFYKFLVRIFYPKCRAIIIPSTTEFTRFYNFCPHNAVYLPNPISKDVQLACYFDNDDQNRISMQSSSRYILTVGRLTYIKNHEFILKAWRLAVKFIPSDINLVIVGGGEHLSRLRRLCDEYGIMNRVEFVAETKYIIKYYQNCMFLVHTALSEGFSLVIAESLLMSKPVIAYDCESGPRDMIIDSYNGYLLPDLDIMKFVQKIILLACNSKLLAALSSNCQHSIPHVVHSPIEQTLTELIF